MCINLFLFNHKLHENVAQSYSKFNKFSTKHDLKCIKYTLADLCLWWEKLYSQIVGSIIYCGQNIVRVREKKT